jgi:thiamine pyrophosphate-dependent acetolactate synthase large subunit-like protein
MTPRTGGDWVIAALAAEGVRHVFGIPGVHNLPIYNALLRQSVIHHTLARHEQGAAFMADGYARSSGRPGVLIVTTGPGATNTLTALAESYSGSIPVVAIMSDVPLAVLGREVGALHEIVNQIECFKPACRWAQTVTEGRLIASDIQGAFALLESGRPGPIALSIPADLLAGPTDGRIVARQGRGRPPCHVEDIREVARLLAAAERPLLIAGGGVVASGATGELSALARRLGAPVITTVSGRGAMSDADPLWHGVLPNRRATEEVIRAADVVFAVGCRFAHRSTQGLLLNLSFAPDQVLIHLDVDAAVIGRLFKPRLGIVGDARDGLHRLLGLLAPTPRAADWRSDRLRGLRSAANDRYTPAVERFIQVLRESLADDAIVVNDQTGINYWMEWRFPVLAPRTFLYPVGTATLGYGVPAAIGAKIANPERQVVAVVGDGGFMFSVNELATAVKYGLGVVFVVVNDDRYGAIKYLQERMFGLSGEIDLLNPDFPLLSQAFGAAGERVASLDQLGDALPRALARSGPTVVELRMAVEPPWEL